MIDIEMRDIPGYEGLYAATKHTGQIWSYRRNIFLKDRADKDGYRRITLHTEDKKMKTYQVHRLIALAWLPNPENYDLINHKDEIKTNNDVDNLEWCDYKYNNNYGTRLDKVKKPVICVETGERYNSIKEAAAANNVSVTSVSSCLRGVTKTCLGKHWVYADRVEKTENFQ